MCVLQRSFKVMTFILFSLHFKTLSFFYFHIVVFVQYEFSIILSYFNACMGICSNLKVTFYRTLLGSRSLATCALLLGQFFFFSSGCSVSSGRTGEPGEHVVDSIVGCYAYGNMF